MDNPFKSPAVLSLCPGFLGLERGLIRAIGPIRVAAYVEIEAFIIQNLVDQMEQGFLDAAPIWSNIKTLNGSIFRNKINGIIGGYPCQPFSNAGARNGTSDPRHLYPFISGIIQAARPIWCFFENVEGHLTLGYAEVSADLRSMGYAVEAGMYSAEELGATHERYRLFILAIKQEFVANPNGGRSGEDRKQSEFWATGTIKSPCDSWITSKGKDDKGRFDRWPAGPGENQYKWEAPRIKPSMGSAIDGYNFRDDLLRAYGNSVVEQTAEFAFSDLLKKHLG